MNRLKQRVRAWLSGLLLAALVAGLFTLTLPLAAQEATPAAPTAEPTDGPPPDGPATTINGVALYAAEFQQRVRLTRFLYAFTIRETLRTLVAQGTPPQDAFRAVQQFYSAEINRLVVPDLLADAVLDTMEEDALLAQLAEAEGIAVTDADVDASLAAYVGQENIVVGTGEPAEATPEASDPAPDLIAAMLAEASERVGVSEDTIRAFFRGQALRQAWMLAYNGPFPTEWPVLSIRHVLVETEADANDVLARLNSGEDFAAIAQAVSIDTGTARQGGALAPAVAETYVGPFADAVRDAEIGVVIGPVQSEFGYHIIEVTDRSLQPPDAAATRALTRTRNAAFRAWLDEQVASADIQRESGWPDMLPRQPVGTTLLQEMLDGM